MRVCFVSHTANLKGAERALLELVLALRRSHVESFVILPRRDLLFQELTKHGITCAIVKYDPWIETGKSGWYRRKALLLSAVKIVPMIVHFQRWKVDLVCTNSIVVFTGALAAWFGRKGHLWFIHEFIEEEYGLTCFLPLLLTLRLVDIWSKRILLASRALQEEYSKYFPIEKTQVVYQAALTNLVPQRVPPIPFKVGKGLKCVTVGTLLSARGYADAIKAVGYLNKRGYRVHLTIVGDGPERENLETLVKSEDVEDKVSFTGFLASAPSVIEVADVVLACSRKEGFGRVKVEAMRTGKPIIAAALEGGDELLRDGFNALLYEPGNHEELAEKILLLLQSPALRSKLGRNGKRFAEQFSSRAYAANVLEQFNKVLSQE